MKYIIFFLCILSSGCLDVSPAKSEARSISGPGTTLAIFHDVVGVALGGAGSEADAQPRNPYYLDATVTGVLRRENSELRIYPGHEIAGAEGLVYLVLRGDVNAIGAFGGESELEEVNGVITDDVGGRSNVRYFDVARYSPPKTELSGRLFQNDNYLTLQVPVVRSVRIFFNRHVVSPKWPPVLPQPGVWYDTSVNINKWPEASITQESNGYVLWQMNLDDGSVRYELRAIDPTQLQSWIDNTGYEYDLYRDVDMQLSLCVGLDGSTEVMNALYAHLAERRTPNAGIYGTFSSYAPETNERYSCGGNYFGVNDMGFNVYRVLKWTIN